MSLRINFFGGPSAGKSSTASWLFTELKDRRVSVELVNEYVKSYAYQKRPIKEFDQIKITGKQLDYEYRFLSSGVKNIVTDSPVLLGAIYSEFYNPEIKIYNPIIDIVKEFDKIYKPINIFLDRKEKPYVQEGRYQDLDGAKEIDKLLLNALKKHYSENFHIVDWNDRQEIFNIVWKAMVEHGTNK